MSGDANPVEFPSLCVQDRLLVTSDFFLPVLLRRRRLGIQDYRVADVLGNEWDVARSDGMRGKTPFCPVEIRKDSWSGWKI